VDVLGGTGGTSQNPANGGAGVFTSQPLAPPAAAPEPSIVVLQALGGLTLAVAHRRRKNHPAPANPCCQKRQPRNEPEASAM
jgi:hypothetical protein